MKSLFSSEGTCIWKYPMAYVGRELYKRGRVWFSSEVRGKTFITDFGRVVAGIDLRSR